MSPKCALLIINDYISIFLNELIQFYLNNTINIRHNDVTESTVTIRSSFCGHNMELKKRWFIKNVCIITSLPTEYVSLISQ